MLPHTGLFLLWKVALQMRIRPLVEAGGTIAVGDEVAADAQGAAVKAAGNDKIAGTARSAASTVGEVIQVFLKG